MKGVLNLSIFLICSIVSCSSAYENDLTRREVHIPGQTEMNGESGNTEMFGNLEPRRNTGRAKIETKRYSEGRETTEVPQNIETTRYPVRGEKTDLHENTESRRYTEAIGNAQMSENTEARRITGRTRNTETYANMDGIRITGGRGNIRTQEYPETRRGADERGNTEERRNVERSRNTEPTGNTEMQGFMQRQRNKETRENTERKESTSSEKNIMYKIHYPERRGNAPAGGNIETRVDTESTKEASRTTGYVRNPGRNSGIPTRLELGGYTDQELDPVLNERVIKNVATNVRELVPQVTDTITSIFEAIAGSLTNQRQPQPVIRTRCDGYEQSRKTLITTEVPTNNELTEDDLRGLIAYYQRQLAALQLANQQKIIS